MPGMQVWVAAGVMCRAVLRHVESQAITCLSDPAEINRASFFNWSRLCAGITLQDCCVADCSFGSTEEKHFTFLSVYKYNMVRAVKQAAPNHATPAPCRAPRPVQDLALCLTISAALQPCSVQPGPLATVGGTHALSRKLIPVLGGSWPWNEEIRTSGV